MAYYEAESICRSPEEEATIGEGIDRSYRTRWDVVIKSASPTTSFDISVLQVYENIAGLPRYGDIWISKDGMRSDPLAVMRRFTGRRDHNDKAKFSLFFDYSVRGSMETPRSSDRDVAGGTTDLSLLFPVWSLTAEDRMYVPEDGKDLDGARFVNSAGDPFEPGVELNDPIIVLNYSRYETSFNGYTAFQLINDIRTYKYLVNSDTFLLGDLPGGDNFCWLIAEYSLRPELIGNNRVIRRDMTIKYSGGGWRERILDQGLNELIDNTALGAEPGAGGMSYYDWSKANRKAITAPRSNQPITKPVPLRAGIEIDDMATTHPEYKSFRTKESGSFAGLGVELI